MYGRWMCCRLQVASRRTNSNQVATVRIEVVKGLRYAAVSSPRKPSPRATATSTTALPEPFREVPTTTDGGVKPGAVTRAVCANNLRWDWLLCGWRRLLAQR